MAENLEGHLKRFGISKEQVQNFPDSNVSTIIDRITDLEGVKPKNSDNGVILTRLAGYLTNSQRFEIKRDESGSYTYKSNNAKL